MDSGVKVLKWEKRNEKRKYAWACKEIDAWVVCGWSAGSCEYDWHGDTCSKSWYACVAVRRGG